MDQDIKVGDYWVINLPKKDGSSLFSDDMNVDRTTIKFEIAPVAKIVNIFKDADDQL